MARAEANDLRSFSQFVEIEANRSLDLLKAIDDTIYAAIAVKERIDSMIVRVFDAIEQIHRLKTPIDHDGQTLARMYHSRDVVGAAYDELLSLKKQVEKYDRPDGDSDGVIGAYGLALDSVSAFHNGLNDLCRAIGEHEADLQQPLPGKFESVDDLFAAMRKGE